VDMAGAFGDEISGLFGPFDTGDGVRVIHEILKTNIFQFVPGIQAVTVKVIKWHLGFIDMHQHKGRALHLLGVFEPKPSATPLMKVVFPLPRCPSRQRTVPGLSSRANPFANSIVSWAEHVVIVCFFIVVKT